MYLIGFSHCSGKSSRQLHVKYSNTFHLDFLPRNHLGLIFFILLQYASQASILLQFVFAMSLRSQNSYFETLTAESLYLVIDLLLLSEIKQLSCTNTLLRRACLPFLFHHVKFQFSESGFNDLRSLLNSEAHQHVVSFTYMAP